MNKLINFLWVLVRPRFWMFTGHEKFNEYFDKSINQLLDAGEPFKVLGQYEAQLGSYILWIANYPYASFTSKLEITVVDGKTFRAPVRPSRRTIKRLKDAFCSQYPELSFLFD